MRRAGFFGDHPLRDKEHQLASRKCRRESTPQTPVNAASIRAVGAVDPVAPRNITKKKQNYIPMSAQGFLHLAMFYALQVRQGPMEN